MPQLKHIISSLETLAPPYLAESWDNVGLMIGDRKSDIHKVLVALDVTEKVVDEAIANNVNLIVSHHPFIFKGLKSIDTANGTGRSIFKLIQHGISVYSMHTNYDITYGGLNDYLIKLLGAENLGVLDVTYEEALYKVKIYTPKTHIDIVRDTIIKNMNTNIGSYEGCTFTSPGEGTFIPLEGANPYLGTNGVLEKADEVVISFMCTKSEYNNIINEVMKVHPYEEIAIDMFKLENMNKKYGLGRVGKLKEEMSLADFVAKVKKDFNVDYIKTNIEDFSTYKPINKIAVVSGAGSEFISKASKYDVYITGDVKYHEMQVANERGLCVLDVGHYGSESIALKPIVDCLKTAFENLDIQYSQVNSETIFVK